MILSETWFLEGYIDFELQKYRLLSYLKEVEQQFQKVMLYPHLSDVILHYNNLNEFRRNKRLLQEQFPKQMEGVNVEQLELLYKRLSEDDELMNELESITEYGVHQMKYTIDEGARIYDFVETHTRIEPVGILPIYKNEGYVFLTGSSIRSVNVYSYTVTLFEHKDAKYRGVRMTYVDKWNKTAATTYEQLKTEVIKAIRILPNPAVFFVESSIQAPLEETILPIAKRMLVKHIGSFVT